MNFLLDTKVALWAITDDIRLGQKARDLIQSPKSKIWISAVSLWEISFKHSLSKEVMPISSSDAIQYFRTSGYQLLSIDPEHIAFSDTLSTYLSDPYDRMLLAQALSTPLRLVTSDPSIADISDTVIHV